MDAYISPMDNFKIGVVCVHIWADVRKPTTMRKIRRIIVWVAIIPSKYVFLELFRLADRRSLL